ncbi:GntR family transcriptional regulator [Pelobacter seleniigenes]|uniref:GntR family transcriptional regulator n=1 Tax=Pelobacter seleniigenes TaxID=407188 RepID=UPI0004A72198|nr:GntR family transcriptional regulator [Pelobacter seleniigenes]
MAIIKKTYKDQVVDHVYELLLTGELSPGQQLKESLLAAQMGISRAPIREAMKELIMNGLVDYRPQVGNFIPVLSPKEIIDSYTTRGVLEGYAVMESCGNFSADEFDTLFGLTEEMENHALALNQKLVVEVGGQFHDLLISRCHNLQVIEYTNRLSLKLHILFYKYWGTLYDAREIGRRHRLIAEAVHAQEPLRIEQVIREHYRQTGSLIAELRQGA